MTEDADNKVILPNVRLSLRDIPEAEEWGVGKVYDVGFDLRLTSIHKDDGKDGGYAEFEVVGIDSAEEEDDDEDDGEDEDVAVEQKRYNRK